MRLNPFSRRNKSAVKPRMSKSTVYLLLALVALGSVPQWMLMPVHLAVICMATISLRCVFEYFGWPPLHRFLRLFLALAAFFIAWGSHGHFGRRFGASLLTVMLAMKLLESYRSRDGAVLVLGVFFLLVTQYLFRQNLLLLGWGILTIVLGYTVLTRLQRDSAFRTIPSIRAVPKLRGQAKSLRDNLLLFGLAAPFAVALFLLFPRWDGQLWGYPEQALDGKTGLSDSMSPGDIQNLLADDSPAFRVTFDGPLPRRDQLYWRGPTLWHFNGRQWRSGFYSDNITARSLPSAGTGDISYQVQLEPHERRWLFALDYPADLPAQSRLTLDYQLINRLPVTELKVYTIRSNPDFTDTPDLSAPLAQTALQLPADFNPRTRELINRWRSETPDASALVQRILRYFNQQEFFYTLSPPELGRHSVDEFLFETRRGFCEHYASAFAVMMRMADIPARVTTGYLGGYYNSLGDYLLVKQSDAHAWTEIWLPQSGWTRVDPTAAVAPGRVENNVFDLLPDARRWHDIAWLKSLRNSFDFVQHSWNQWVLTFNAAKQRSLFRPFGWDSLKSHHLIILLILAIAVISLLVTPLIRRLAAAGNPDPVQKQYLKLLKKLRGAGLDVGPSLTAHELREKYKKYKNYSELDNILKIYYGYKYQDLKQLGQRFIQAARRFSVDSG